MIPMGGRPIPIRGGHLTALGAIVFACASLTACSSEPLPTPTRVADDTSRIELSEVESIAVRLNCAKLWNLFDDVHFYDSMRGFECWTGGDNAPLTFRVYESGSSPQYVLPDWEGLVSAQRPLLRGANWFAIGAPSDLEVLESVLDVDLSTTQVVPLEPSDPLSAHKVGVGVCSTAVVTFVEDEVVYGSPWSEEEIEAYEDVFPGLADQARNVVVELQHTGKISAESFNFEITRFGNEIKEFCAGVV